MNGFKEPLAMLEFEAEVLHKQFHEAHEAVEKAKELRDKIETKWRAAQRAAETLRGYMELAGAEGGVS